MKPTWHLFPLWTLNQSLCHQIPNSRAKTISRRSQTCVKYRGIIICILKKYRYEHKWSENTSKKCPNRLNYLDVNFNFSKLSCGLPPTYCYTGELWLLWFIWHHGPRVTHCLSSAMIFFFKQYSFCNSFRHCLLHIHVFNIMESCE